jgi:hypothetical protein
MYRAYDDAFSRNDAAAHTALYAPAALTKSLSAIPVLLGLVRSGVLRRNQDHK